MTTAVLSLSERFHWFWWERGAAAGEGEVLVVRHKFRGAAQGAGEDLMIVTENILERTTQSLAYSMVMH